jgi:hypothetical protein
MQARLLQVRQRRLARELGAMQEEQQRDGGIAGQVHEMLKAPGGREERGQQHGTDKQLCGLGGSGS